MTLDPIKVEYARATHETVKLECVSYSFGKIVDLFKRSKM